MFQNMEHALLPYKDGFLRLLGMITQRAIRTFKYRTNVGNPIIESKMFFHTLLMKDTVHYYLRI